MAYYLGVDVGTSSIKLTAIDESCQVVATASSGYVPMEPFPGWRELRPGIWWEAFCLAATDLGKKLSLAAVAGVCVTGQMHTIVLLDEDGHAVRDAILWNDLRTVDMSTPARAAMLHAGETNIANIVSSGSPAANLSWIREHDPEAFEKTHVFVGVPDWLAMQLGATPGVDWCGASTSSLFSIEKLSWSKGACLYFGIPRDMLPQIENADDRIGGVSALAAKETGIPEGIPIFRGTGDNPASAIPTGCLFNGSPVISLGTSGVLMYAQDGVCEPSVGKPVLFRANGETKTLVQLTVKSCGSDMEWWVKDILARPSFNLEDSRVEDIAYDTGDLLFFPHLNGEKVLYGDMGVRGCFMGLGLCTTQSELTRAVMEGIAFGLRSLKEVVSESGSWTELRLVGGGSASDLWSAIICNTLGLPVIRVKTSGAGQGAALLALSSVGNSPIAELAGSAEEIIDRIEPTSHIVHRYDEKFERYQRLYSAITSVLGK